MGRRAVNRTARQRIDARALDRRALLPHTGRPRRCDRRMRDADARRLRARDDAYRARPALWRGETVWARVRRDGGAPAGDARRVVEGDTPPCVPRRSPPRAERLAGGLAALGIGAGRRRRLPAPELERRRSSCCSRAARLGAVANPILPDPPPRASSASSSRQSGRARRCSSRAATATATTASWSRALRAELPALDARRSSCATTPAPACARATRSPAAPPPRRRPRDAERDRAPHLHLGHDRRRRRASCTRTRRCSPRRGASARCTASAPATRCSCRRRSPTSRASCTRSWCRPSSARRAVLMDRWDAGEALALIAARARHLHGGRADLPARPGAASRRSPRPTSRASGSSRAAAPTSTRRSSREAAARLGCVAKRVYGSTEFPTITTTGPDDPPARRIDSDGRADRRRRDPPRRRRRRAPSPPGARARSSRAARSASSATATRRSTPRRSPPTAGSAPATSARSTPTGYLRITGRQEGHHHPQGREHQRARGRGPARRRTPPWPRWRWSALPDAAAGEIACAVLRLRAGRARRRRSPTLARTSLARGLSKRKLPERLEVVDDFPRTASGKILKRALRERLARG